MSVNIRKGTYDWLQRYFEGLTTAGRESMRLRFGRGFSWAQLRNMYPNQSDGQALTSFIASRGRVRVVCNELAS